MRIDFAAIAAACLWLVAAPAEARCDRIEPEIEADFGAPPARAGLRRSLPAPLLRQAPAPRVEAVAPNAEKAAPRRRAAGSVRRAIPDSVLMRHRQIL